MGGSQCGLFATQLHRKGEVLMSVPRELAIVVDYNAGLTLPEGAWPRLREGIMRAEPLPWDLLEALALIDAAEGDGDAMWQEYCSRLMPRPEALTLPMCWAPERLRALQHDAIEQGAQQQQARLQSMFPDFSAPSGDAELPTRMQWALACVKSRAYRVGEEAFAMVPFIDMTNHAADPNADFRASAASSGGGTAGSSFELYAVRDIASQEEVTVSYSGPDGYTNQRWMAQYGFVPSGGNTSDRLAFVLPDGAPPQLLDLQLFQDALGDQLFMGIVSGRAPAMYAAMKSLPIAGEAPASSSQRPDADTTSASSSADARARQLQLVDDLLQQAQRAGQGATSSVEQDEETLAALAAGRLVLDARAEAAVRYRLERKRLASACCTLLQLYRKALFAGHAPQP